MIKEMMAAIYDAIENDNSIRITMEFGANAISTSVQVSYSDTYASVVNNIITILNKDDVIVINANSVEYDDDENTYICESDNGIVTIEFE